MALSPSFVQQWTDDVHQLAQQMDSRLMSAVRLHRGVKAATYNFHTLGSVNANTRANGSYAEVTPLDPTSAVAAATLVNIEAPIFVPEVDLEKVNFDAKREIQKSSIAAVNREIDDLIITELATATNTMATTTGSLTFAKVQEAAEFLNSSDVPFEDRVLVVGAKQWSALVAEQKFTSHDYAAAKGNTITGMVQGALGFNTIILSNRLPLAGSDRTVFGFSKMALGFAVGKDVTATIDWVPVRQSWLVLTKMSGGAALIDNSAVAKITCAE